MMHAVLASHVSRQLIATPRVNHMKVVINGEGWGVYANAEQFNKEFTREWFGSAKGARWKVPGSPRGGGGLVYLNGNLDQYKRNYEIRTADDPKAWKRLDELCKILNETPIDQLDKALEPILDLENVVRFLALDDVLVNEDGYWIRDSDYSIYLGDDGRFRLIPHDLNETFHSGGGPGGGGRMRAGGQGGPGGPFGPGGQGIAGPGGPGGPAGPGGPGGEGPRGLGGPGGEGGRGGPGGGPRFAGPGGPGGMRGGGVDLDPLFGLDDNSGRKPLRTRLLKNETLKRRYLVHVRTIARDFLDWKKLTPLVEQYKALIEEEVKADTKKLGTYEGFKQQMDTGEAPNAQANAGGGGGGRPPQSLRQFIEKRREYLLNHPAIKALPAEEAAAR
jgi:spore coat protein CotH